MAKPGVPYVKGRKFCIFCSAPANSEEHIKPKWAHSLLPKTGEHRLAVGRGRRGATVELALRKKGAVYTTRIGRVCKPCNEGWMSDFGEQVKPFLSRMIQGRRTFLNRVMRDTLAQYFTYKMLVLDWLGEDPVLPAEWARQFYLDRQIPEGVFIWLFHCIEGKWQTDIETEGVGLADINDPRTPAQLPINTKSFAVGFDNLFVFAVLSTEIDLNIDFNPLLSIKLWPFEPKLMVWPPYAAIDSENAEYIRHTISRMAESPAVIIGQD